MDSIFRRHDVDMQQIRLIANLSPAKRIQLMLNAQKLAAGLIRGRLRRQYPDLSWRELNLKLVEEIERVKNRTYPRF